MANEIDPFKLSSPRIYLVRMLVFLILCALVVIVLDGQIWPASLPNPGRSALIMGFLVMEFALSSRQVFRLFPKIIGVTVSRPPDRGLAVEHPPVLLAPMAVILG